VLQPSPTRTRTTCVTRVLGRPWFAPCAREATVTRAENLAFENVAEATGDRFLDEITAQRERWPPLRSATLSSNSFHKSTARAAATAAICASQRAHGRTARAARTGCTWIVVNEPPGHDRELTPPELLLVRARRWAGRASTLAEHGPTVVLEAGGIGGDCCCVPRLVRILCALALFAGPVVHLLRSLPTRALYAGPAVRARWPSTDRPWCSRPEVSAAIAAAYPASSGASARSRSLLGRSCEHDGRAWTERGLVAPGRRCRRRSRLPCLGNEPLLVRALRWAGRASTITARASVVRGARPEMATKIAAACLRHEPLLLRSLPTRALYAGPAVRARWPSTDRPWCSRPEVSAAIAAAYPASS